MSARSRRDRGGSSDSAFDNQVKAARRNRELIARLAQWRAKHGPSQAEAAKRMHTSQPAIARLESHQHDAQLSTLARYVAAIGLSLDFVLTDAKTGSRIWDSMGESEGTDEMEVTSPPKINIERVFREGSTSPTEKERRGLMGLKKPRELVRRPAPALTPGLFIVGDTWNRLSQHDLQSKAYVVTTSEQPGWDLLYTSSEEGAVTIGEVKRYAGRTERAEDSQVLGIFGPEDPDPVAIATVTEPDAREFHQIHTLTAKVRAEDQLSVIITILDTLDMVIRHTTDKAKTSGSATETGTTDESPMT